MIEKNLLYWLFVSLNELNQIVFTVSIKLCDEWGLAILLLSRHTMFKRFTSNTNASRSMF